jgi:hypothetical protein
MIQYDKSLPSWQMFLYVFVLYVCFYYDWFVLIKEFSFFLPFLMIMLYIKLRYERVRTRNVRMRVRVRERGGRVRVRLPTAPAPAPRQAPLRPT